MNPIEFCDFVWLRFYAIRRRHRSIISHSIVDNITLFPAMIVRKEEFRYSQITILNLVVVESVKLKLNCACSPTKWEEIQLKFITWNENLSANGKFEIFFQLSRNMRYEDVTWYAKGIIWNLLIMVTDESWMFELNHVLCHGVRVTFLSLWCSTQLILIE